jgi:glycosyltransferase involved in cell wall biosynthesis
MMSPLVYTTEGAPVSSTSSPISVLVLTHNEAQNIGECIASIPWRGDLHVLDSGSSDTTIEIARDLGAKISVRPFDDYARQRNAGLGLPFENQWIVMLDADERMTESLALEIETVISQADLDLDMLLVRRRDHFMGRWLKRASGYPTWFARVVKRGHVRVERAVNERYVAIGKTAYLEHHLDHYPFQKGVGWWFDRHNRYSETEAALLLGSEGNLRWRDLLSSDAIGRRAALKALAYRTPARPFLIFLYLYVIRGGFLDGTPGYTFASMRMAYEIMIDAKRRSAKAERSPGH